MNAKSFAAFASLVALAAFGVSPAVRSAVHAQQSSADRVIAERVLRLGGAVILDGQRTPMSDLHELPDTDFRIHTLDLVGVSMGAWGLRDEILRWPSLPHLKALYLNGRLWYGQPDTLVADTIALFNGSPNLEKFVLSKPVQTYIPMEDTVVKRMIMPGLEEMRLHQTRLPGDALAPFTNLKHLDLSHNIFFDDRGLRHTAKMPGLTKLYLEDTSVTDQGLKNLSGLVQLTELNLDGTKTTDSGLAALSGLTNLRRLESCRHRDHRWRRRVADAHDAVADADAVSNAHLERRPRATRGAEEPARPRRAIYARHRVGVKDLQAKLPGLTVLFQDSSVPHGEARCRNGRGRRQRRETAIGKWLSAIGASVRMREGHAVAVGLASTSMNDRELALLQELPHLEELSLRDTEVSDLGVAHLAGLRALKKLDLSSTSLSDSALAHLKSLTGLQSLDLSHTLVEGGGLAALSAMTAVARAESEQRTSSTDAGMAHLRTLTALETLSLNYTDVTDPGLEPIAGLIEHRRTSILPAPTFVMPGLAHIGKLHEASRC